MSASLTKLKERVAREEPEYEKYLIHVLVSTKAGELCKSFRFAQYQFIDAAERWHGACSMHPEKAFFEAEPAEGVHIVTAPGGSGMTLSFGLAERTMNGLGL